MSETQTQDMELHGIVNRLRSETTPKEKKRLLRISNVFIQKWGDYIPEKKREELGAIGDKIIIVEDDEFQALRSKLKAKPDIGLNEEEIRRKNIFAEIMANYYSGEIGKEIYGRVYPNSSRTIESAKRLIEVHGENVHRVFFGSEPDDEIIGKVLADVPLSPQDSGVDPLYNTPIAERATKHQEVIMGCNFSLDNKRYILLRKPNVEPQKRMAKLAFKIIPRGLVNMAIDEYIDTNASHEIAHLLQAEALG